MTATTKEKVAALAEQHGIVRSRGESGFLAKAFSRISGIDGDETLEMIADLLKARVIINDEATALVLSHVRECRQSDSF